MGNLLQLSEIRKSGGDLVTFEVIERVESTQDDPALRDWAVDRLAAHHCDLGLYVAESGHLDDDGEDKITADAWIVWDGVASIRTC